MTSSASPGGVGGSGTLRQPRQRSLSLTGVAEPVLRGREFTRRTLADWSWLPEPRDPSDPMGLSIGDDVLLLVSETLSNACLHAGGPTEVVITASGAVLRVEVRDASTVVPKVTVPRPALPGGYGLLVVRLLSDRWGTTVSAGGKAVWFEVDAARIGGPEAGG
ncbi:ATP-binding protein [Kitasatospora sp. GP82]|uniref:ATP-binding protein n=1 Tax=Kitasatospora sp. GP82 TaxID=3035089 RepID=UPI002474E560|nr:ATP-binding protein [Kitasatospora sp. GP82]